MLPGMVVDTSPGALACLRFATGPGDEVVERLEHHLFRHAVDGQVEVALAVALHTDAGDVHAVALAVHVDHELGGHALAAHRRRATGLRQRQQGLGLSVPAARSSRNCGRCREHGVGQHVLLGLGQAPISSRSLAISGLSRSAGRTSMTSSLPMARLRSCSSTLPGALP